LDKKMQGETAAASGYANAGVAQPADDDLAEADIDAFSNLATATSVDRGTFSTLTDANSLLTKQLEENAQALKENRALLKKERNDRCARKPFTPSLDSYCWTRGYNIAKDKCELYVSK
jgi:predicted RecB family nuclease